MTFQDYAEEPDSRGDNEPIPEGYAETLKDCTTLAVNFLNQAIRGEEIKRCWDCSNWIGRCTKGQIWRIARDEACEEFLQKTER